MKQTYKVDPAHSSAQFTVRHMMVTNVRGSFSGVEGTVVCNPDNPAESQVDVVINASTVNTLEPQRDAHLKSADFLDVEKYPTITFKSKRVTPKGDARASRRGRPYHPRSHERGGSGRGRPDGRDQRPVGKYTHWGVRDDEDQTERVRLDLECRAGSGWIPGGR